MASPINPLTSSGTIFRLLYPSTPSIPSDDGDFLSGITSRLASRLNAAQEARSRLQRFETASAALAGPKGNDLFEQRSATSDVPTALRAKAKAGATQRTYSVTVSQVAKAQQLQSDRLNDSAAASAPASSRISLTVAGKTTQVDVTTTAGDTNAATLSKAATAINAASAGVRAEVVKGDTAETSRLQLTSGATGTDARITVADTTGTLAADIGLRSAGAATAASGGISTDAQNAAYAIDGGASVTAQGNDVSLDNGKVTVTLTAPAATQAKLTVATSGDAIKRAVGTFVDAFNESASYAKSVGTALPKRFAQSLQGFITANATSLGSIGISRNTEGGLSLDTAKLVAALSSDPEKVARTFNDGQTGLARDGRQLSTTLRNGLTSESATAARELSQAFARQQLSTSYDLLGARYKPIADLLQAGTFNSRA